jgi:GR25 family glycosyltransferase involved in LPS biosynthesis
MSGNIKKIFIINLDRRKDRLEEAMNNINETCLQNFDYTRVSAFDGKNVEEEKKRFSKLNKYINKLDDQIKDFNLKPLLGEYGCMISHLSVLDEIANDANYNNDDYFCIFEDDFFYSATSDSFNTSFNQINQQDLVDLKVDFLYVGGRFTPNFYSTNIELFERTDNINIFKRKSINTLEENDRCLTAYIINKKSCQKLINFITEKIYYSKRGIKYFGAVDFLVAKFNEVNNTHDYFPHLFYSPRNYKTDIQTL